MSETKVAKELRDKYLAILVQVMTENGEEVLQVAGTELAMPVVDAEGNDTWVTLKVTVPKGEKLEKGKGYAGYDGYQQAEFYKNTQKEKEAKKAETAAKNKAKELAKEKARKIKEAKKAEREAEVEVEAETVEEVKE